MVGGNVEADGEAHIDLPRVTPTLVIHASVLEVQLKLE